MIHSDECIYSKLCHIIWKNPTVYKNLVFLMGGFHQIRVMQRILYKRYYSRGIGPLLVDAETIAKGSCAQAMEGRHYYRCLRVHKELFDALVQLRFEKIKSTSTDDHLFRALKKLRNTPGPVALNELLSLKSYNQLVKEITKFAVNFLSI